MAKKKSKYWVDDASILPEIVVTPQGNYPILDDAGNPGMTVGAIQDINPNAQIYERTYNQVPQADSFNTEKPQWWWNNYADQMDQAVVPHIGDFVSAVMKPMDALMPSRYFGLFDSDYDGLSAGQRLLRIFDDKNRGLFINNNPYGLFSKRYAEEHPYWAVAGNTAFDIPTSMAAGWAVEKGWNAASNAYNTGKASFDEWNRARQLSRAINGDVRGTTFNVGEPVGGRVLPYRGQTKTQVPSLGLGEASEVLDNRSFLKQINDFADKYGYQGLDEAGNYSSAELEAYAKSLIDRHNKFYRGVFVPENPEDLQSIRSIIGENATDEEILQYVSTHGRKGEDGFFVSPYNTVGDKYGKQAIVSRPYTLGKDRTKWFEEGDYNVAEGKDNGLENAFYDPWGTPQYSGAMGPLDYQPTQEAIDAFGFKYMPSSGIPTELVSKDDLIFRGWADENSFPLLSRKTPNVAGRISVPRITEENSINIPLKEWNRQHKDAYEMGDAEEGQRLWDLWFRMKAPNNTLIEKDKPLRLFHGSPNKFYSFDVNAPRIHDEGTFGRGIYATDRYKIANAYANDGDGYVYELYGKIDEPFADYEVASGNFGYFDSLDDAIKYYSDDFSADEIRAMLKNIDTADGVIASAETPYDEVVFKSGKQIKSADPFTFDDSGNLIPLTERANFNVNDMRYGLIPWLLGTGTAATAYGISQQDDSVQAYGGPLKAKSWNDLSMKEKSEMIRVGVKNGLTRISDIRDKYNEFAEGGYLDEDVNIYGGGGNTKKRNGGNSQRGFYMSPNAQYAMRYFMDKGMPLIGAAGLVGGFMRESSTNLSTGALNPSSKALGIAQWLGPRKKELIRRYGPNPTLQQQLDFVWYELNTSYRKGLNALMNAKTPTEAADAALGWYEFSVGPQGAVAAFNKTGQNGQAALMRGRQYTHQILGLPMPEIAPSNININQQQMTDGVNRAFPQNGWSNVPLMPMPSTNVDYTKVLDQQIQLMQAEQEERNRQLALQQEKEQREAERAQRIGALNFALSMTDSVDGDNDDDSYLSGMMGLLSGNSKRLFGGGGNVEKDNTAKPARPFVRNDVPFSYVPKGSFYYNNEGLMVGEDGRVRSHLLDDVVITPEGMVNKKLPLVNNTENLYDVNGLNAWQRLEKNWKDSSAYGFDRMFADALTLGSASNIEHGVNTLQDSNATWRDKVTAVADILSPALLISPAARLFYGATHLADKEGVEKTIDKFTSGDYAGGVQSALGDAFNLLLAGEGGYNSANNALNFAASQGNKTAQGIQLARAINGDVRGTAFNVGEPLSTRQNAPIYNGIIRSSTNSQTISISPEDLYKFLQDQEDYYFLGHGTGRTSVSPETIFNSGLRIKKGDVGNTTIPVSESNLTSWPHLNSEEVILLPGKVEMSKYDSPYGHIPTDWYDSETFHWNDNPPVTGSGFFAVQEPHATFVESTKNGVPGIYTKPEAVLGSYNTRTNTLQLNPNSQYQFHFNTEPSTISWEEALDNPTNNLLKWLGKPADYKPKVSLLDSNGKAGIQGSAEEKLMNIFELNGIDLSRLSMEDLTEALKLREKEIISSAPERYTYAQAEGVPSPSYTLLDYMNGNKVGRTPVRFEDDGNVHIEMTRNLTQRTKDPVHKVEERGLNSAINLAHTFGGEGAVSGRQYLSAPRQYPVVQKFRDREVISNTGDHNNWNMVFGSGTRIPQMSTFRKLLAMRRAGDEHRAIADNMPVWLLKEPTFPTPTKSNLFDPTIIDASGKMNIEWWNPNVLKSVLYPTFLGTALYNLPEND